MIPKAQKARFEKDIAMIFKGVDETEDESHLQKMSKLAQTKLKSIERIYGGLREEDKSEAKNFNFLDESTIEMFKKVYGFDVDPNRPIKSKIEEIKMMPGFNAEKVKKYQEEYKEYKAFIQKAYYTAQEQIQQEKLKDKQSMVEQIMAQGSPMDLTAARDDEGNVDREKLKNALREIMAMNNVQNVDERLAELDIDQFLGEMRNPHSEEVKKKNEMIEQLKNSSTVDSTTTKELFAPLDTQRKVSEEEVDEFVKKVKPIFEDKNLSDEEKKKLYLSELSKAETEWEKNNLDGYITYGPYGDIQVNIFKDVEEGEENKSEGNKPKETAETGTGVKNYVWRDGKLVEGKAKERKVVTYSNWTTGHLNPDDMRKHRELLDRQHFGGPLWEGIQYVGNLTKAKGYTHIHPPTPEDLENMEKNKIDLPKEEGKREFVEIVR